MYCSLCLAAARHVDDDVRAAATMFDGHALCLTHFLDQLDHIGSSPTQAEDGF